MKALILGAPRRPSLIGEAHLRSSGAKNRNRTKIADWIRECPVSNPTGIVRPKQQRLSIAAQGRNQEPKTEL
jgi:hypothetical protein